MLRSSVPRDLPTAITLSEFSHAFRKAWRPTKGELDRGRLKFGKI